MSEKVEITVGTNRHVAEKIRFGTAEEHCPLYGRVYDEGEVGVVFAGDGKAA